MDWPYIYTDQGVGVSSTRRGIYCLYCNSPVRRNTVRQAREDERGVLLAGRRMRWPVVGASLFSTNISAEHYVGYAGGAYLLGQLAEAAAFHRRKSPVWSDWRVWLVGLLLIDGFLYIKLM